EEAKPNATKSRTRKERTPVPPTASAMECPSDWQHATEPKDQPASSGKPRGKALLATLVLAAAVGLLGTGLALWKNRSSSDRPEMIPSPEAYTQNQPASPSQEPSAAVPPPSSRTPPFVKTGRIKTDPAKVEPV